MLPFGINIMAKTTSMPTTVSPKAMEIAGTPGGFAEQGDLFGSLAPSVRTGDVSDRGNLGSARKPVRMSPPRRLPSVMDDGGDAAMQSARQTGAEDQEAGAITSPVDLGRLVRRVRKRRDFSQQAFADLAGVGRRFLSELENGKPTLELGKVLKVADAAGIALFAREC
jgi:y4mF family transcriptional regulator